MAAHTGEDSCSRKIDSESLADYWNANFEKNDVSNWAEQSAPWIIDWISALDLPKEATFFCAGVGDANIVSSLLNLGYCNIIANDISEVALDKLKQNVSNPNVQFVQDDLIAPKHLQNFENRIDVYIDRATLHFFTTCEEKDHYFQQMHRLLKPGGHTILGVFSKDNVPKCCGLDLQLWSIDSLNNRLKEYKTVNAIEMPYEELNGNVRNYIYLKAQKIK